MHSKFNKIVTAFRGMHVSPVKHSSASVTDGRTDGQTDRQMDGLMDRQTDRRTDRQTTDKVIPMCRYASQATQKHQNKPNWLTQTGGIQTEFPMFLPLKLSKEHIHSNPLHTACITISTRWKYRAAYIDFVPRISAHLQNKLSYIHSNPLQTACITISTGWKYRAAYIDFVPRISAHL